MTRPVPLQTFDVSHLAVVPPAPDTDTATLSGKVVPWHTPVERMGVDLVFTPDTLRLPEQLATVKLLIEHDPDRPAGYATAAEVRDDGLHMTFAVAGHPRSAELLAESSALLRDGFSVGVQLDASTLAAVEDRYWSGEPGAPIPMSGVVREVSACAVPQFNDARAYTAGPLATFTPPRPTPSPEESVMPTTTAPPTDLPTSEHAYSLETLAADLAPFLAAQRADPHRLAAFANLADAFDAAWTGDTARFALVDQVTGDNPGVVPPSWLSEIAGIVAVDRPSITALGIRPAPSTGMDVYWPYWDGDIRTLVGEQATEKSEITSVKVSFKRAQTSLKTYAGGSDISYQLLRRSSPEYRAAYLELLLSGYNYITDATFIAAVVAAATPGTVPWDPATGTATELRQALFAASVAVRTATGQPATVAIASDDVFLAIGGLDDLWPSGYGTQNVSGTADAASLTINVSGLPVVNDPWAPPGTLVVSNGRAAGWVEDGPYTATAEDVAKLGQDNAIWGMGAPLVAAPKGVVKITPVLAPLARGTKG